MTFGMQVFIKIKNLGPFVSNHPLNYPVYVGKDTRFIFSSSCKLENNFLSCKMNNADDWRAEVSGRGTTLWWGGGTCP